jgi:hypothetical protein
MGSDLLCVFLCVCLSVCFLMARHEELLHRRDVLHRPALRPGKAITT